MKWYTFLKKENATVGTLYIAPTNDIQAIQDAINATKPATNVVFTRGDYMINRTLHFIEGRDYIGENAVFQCTSECDGPIIKVIERPDAEKSRLEKALSGRPVLMKIARWIYRMLHIPFAPGTFITGFGFYGNGQSTCVHFNHSS